MKKLLLFLGIISILLFTSQAQAIVIVDTGIPNYLEEGWVAGSFQLLGGKFDLTQEYYITEIYGWMAPMVEAAAPLIGTGTISIFGNSGETPDSSALYHQTFSLLDTAEDWRGLSGLNWNLTSGSYWVVFGAASDTLGAYMPRVSPNPLIDEAYFYNGSWYQKDDLNIGVKIIGQPNAIPEPATFSLLGLGLLGLLRRRKKV